LAAAAATAPANTQGIVPSGSDVEFDATKVVAVLDHPRLAQVREAVVREAYVKAAEELAAVLGAEPKPSADEWRAWHYQLGRLRALAGDPLGAARAFDVAAAEPWPLADHARFASAQWLGRAGKHDEALVRAQQVAKGLSIDGELGLVRAEALWGKGDIDGARAAWRAYLATEPRPVQWMTVTLKFAAALLNRPTEERAEEAIMLARRVIYGSAGGAGVGEATAIEKDALGILPFARRKPFETASIAELVSRAKTLISAQQSRQALSVTDALIAAPEAAGPGELGCEAWRVRADALGRLGRKAEAADAYGVAVERCAGLPVRAETLFVAARGSARAGRPAEAVLRYSLLEKEFPEHRLADDARLRGARAVLDLGDEARYTSMLARMPDDYPAGDMVNDGLFELALSRIEKKDFAGAIVPLERALGRGARERAYFAAGRLPYFLGRARIEMGQVDQGLLDLASVIRDYPLSYYMALAHARLSERDPAAAARVVEESLAREPQDAPAVPKSPLFGTSGFLRAVELSRQGEPKLGRAELDRMVAGGMRALPSEILWASALLFARTGAAKESHDILRSANQGASTETAALGEWITHYPTGRWRQAWEVAFPRPYSRIVAAEAARSGIPEALAYAIMREESTFDPRVESAADAIGLMQLIVETARRMAKPLNLPSDVQALKRPEVNIPLGCRYLSVLRRQFPDNPLLAIPGYNAGGGRPRQWVKERPTQDFDLWVEKIPFEETRQYTKRVITSMAAYEFLYAQGRPSEALASPMAASPSARAAIVAAVP
jgi:soluble lytic murein transglycosylase